MNDRDENRVLPAEILSITQGINPNTAENRLSINDNQIATATRSQLFLTDSEFNNLELRSRFEPLPVYGHVAISEGDFVYVVSGYRVFRLRKAVFDPTFQPIPTSSWANQPKQIYRPLRDVWRLNKITNEWYLISTFGRPEILNYGLCGAAGAIVNVRTHANCGLFMNNVILGCALSHVWFPKARSFPHSKARSDNLALGNCLSRAKKSACSEKQARVTEELYKFKNFTEI